MSKKKERELQVGEMIVLTRTALGPLRVQAVKDSGAELVDENSNVHTRQLDMGDGAGDPWAFV